MQINESIDRFEYNINIIFNNLKELGYEFKNSNPITKPNKSLDKIIREIENRAGNLPLALKVLYLKIGSIDFTGFHPDWIGCEYPDPIIIDPIEFALSEIEDWEYAKTEGDEDGPFLFPISPDFYHKADASGGEPYGIYLPSIHDDPLLENEEHKITLINYLNLCIEFGGFPGIKKSFNDNWPLAEIKKGVNII